MKPIFMEDFDSERVCLAEDITCPFCDLDGICHAGIPCDQEED